MILEMASLFLLFIVSFINHFPADAAEPLAFRPHEVTPGEDADADTDPPSDPAPRADRAETRSWQQLGQLGRLRVLPRGELGRGLPAAARARLRRRLRRHRAQRGQALLRDEDGRGRGRNYLQAGRLRRLEGEVLV